jgi:hypothetical protein
MDKTTAIQKLQRSIDQLNQGVGQSTSEASFKRWRRDTHVAIENIFGSNSRHADEFNKIRFTPMAFSSGTDWHEPFMRGLSTARATLESMIQEIE